MIRDVRSHQRILVFASRIVFCQSFADESAHVRLLGALLVVVACDERRLAEASDGEILFLGVCTERQAVTRFSERHLGAFDRLDHLAGHAGTRSPTCDRRDG